MSSISNLSQNIFSKIKKVNDQIQSRIDKVGTGNESQRDRKLALLTTQMVIKDNFYKQFEDIARKELKSVPIEQRNDHNKIIQDSVKRRASDWEEDHAFVQGMRLQNYFNQILGPGSRKEGEKEILLKEGKLGTDEKESMAALKSALENEKRFIEDRNDNRVRLAHKLNQNAFRKDTSSGEKAPTDYKVLEQEAKGSK